MLSVFDIVFNSSYSSDVKIAYLESLDYSQCFNHQHIDNVVGKTKELLSSPEKRKDGLLLLDTLISQCTADTFADHAIPFGNLALNALQGHKNSSTRILSFEVLAKLVSQLPPFPELSRQAAVSLLPNLLDVIVHKTCSNSDKNELEAVLKCLVQCMIHFPGPCGFRKPRIEKFLMSILDTCSESILEKVAHCFALLPGCSGSGLQGTTHQESWSKQAHMVISTLNSLIASVCQYLELDYLTDIQNEHSQLPLPPTCDTDPLNHIFHVSKRFQAIGVCLQEMLSTQFSSSVKVPVEVIIDLVIKVCSVNIQNAGKHPSIEVAAVFSVLPRLQCTALDILSALIQCCKKCLIPYSATINKIFLFMLNSTIPEKKKFGYNTPYGFLRSTVYKTATVWMKAVGTACGFEAESAVIVDHLTGDIIPDEQQTKLQVNKNKRTDEKTSHKKKRGGGMQLVSENVYQKVDIHANNNLCREALRALKEMVESLGNLLPPDVSSKIYKSLIKVVSDLHHQRLNPPIPYQDPRCRHLLYELLQDVILNLSNIPQSYWKNIMYLLTVGQKDHDLEISSFCSRATKHCRAAVKPRLVLWQTPVQSTPTTGFRTANIKISPKPLLNNVLDMSNPHTEATCLTPQKNPIVANAINVHSTPNEKNGFIQSRELSPVTTSPEQMLVDKDEDAADTQSDSQSIQSHVNRQEVIKEDRVNSDESDQLASTLANNDNCTVNHNEEENGSLQINGTNERLGEDEDDSKGEKFEREENESNKQECVPPEKIANIEDSSLLSKRLSNDGHTNENKKLKLDSELLDTEAILAEFKDVPPEVEDC